MGTSVVNLHVRTDDAEAIRGAMADIGTDFRLDGPVNGWVTVYEERSSTQDEQWIARLTADLSGRVAGPVVAFRLHDSDVFRCRQRLHRAVARPVRRRLNAGPGSVRINSRSSAEQGSQQ